MFVNASGDDLPSTVSHSFNLCQRISSYVLWLLSSVSNLVVLQDIFNNFTSSSNGPPLTTYDFLLMSRIIEH
jgi:hypothetical protein